MFRQGKALVPSFSAFAVTHLLRDALRRLRRSRLHRRDGRGPRPDLQRRARLAVVHPRVLPRRRRRAPGPRADGRPRGAEHRLPGHRRRRRPGLGRADPGAHRPLRAVPAARRRRRRQHGDAAEDAAAGRSDGREGAGAAQGQGRGAAVARRRPGDGPGRRRAARPVRPLRAAGRDAAARRRARRPRCRSGRRFPAGISRVDHHARRGAQAAEPAARARRAPADRRDHRRQPRPVRALRQARRRVPLARGRRRRVHDHARAGARTARGAEEVAPAHDDADGAAHAGRPPAGRAPRSS